MFGLCRNFFDDLCTAYRNHWNHLKRRIVGKPVALIPKHAGIIIVFRLITLAILFMALCFSLEAFNTYGIPFDGTASDDLSETETETETETTWSDLNRVGELALIGFFFIILSQSLMGIIIIGGIFYRSIKLKQPARTWEVMPFCIGSTLLLIAGFLELYFATRFKKLDDELPNYVKESWLIAAILTLVGSLFAILDICLLLGSEAKILVTGANDQILEAETQMIEI